MKRERDVRVGIEKLADKIAGEVVDIVTSSKKMSDFSGAVERQQKEMERFERTVEQLKHRLDAAESRLKKQAGGMALDAVEARRAASEAEQRMEQEREDEIMNLVNQIQHLREVFVKLALRVRQLETEKAQQQK